MAAAGTRIRALMVAPDLPVTAPLLLDVLGVPELPPQAARMPPSSGIDRPIALPLRRKSRLDSRPATNSSMTCSWTGPLPLRSSSSRLWSILRDRLASMVPSAWQLPLVMASHSEMPVTQTTTVHRKLPEGLAVLNDLY